MTARQWETASNPETLLYFVEYAGSRRKRLLTACNLCRRLWHVIPVECDRFHGDVDMMYSLVEAAEKCADNPTDISGMTTYGHGAPPACAAFSRVIHLEEDRTPLPRMALRLSVAAVPESETVFYPHEDPHLHPNWRGHSSEGPTQRAEMAAQCHLVRDMFGNPYRRKTIMDTSWRTDVTSAIAQAAYDVRDLPSGELDPHRLAVLADALEGASAPSELVEHLRSPGPHVRGCHVVDLCLGLT